MASGANDDKKRAAMERIKAFNEAQAKKRAASGIPAPAPPIVADPSAVAGQIHTVLINNTIFDKEMVFLKSHPTFSSPRIILCANHVV